MKRVYGEYCGVKFTGKVNEYESRWKGQHWCQGFSTAVILDHDIEVFGHVWKAGQWVEFTGPMERHHFCKEAA